MSENETWFIPPGLKICGHRDTKTCACTYYPPTYRQGVYKFFATMPERAERIKEAADQAEQAAKNAERLRSSVLGTGN